MFSSYFPHHPIAVGRVELDQARQRVERRRDVGCLLRDDHQVIVLSVIGERGAEAIEDPAARRGNQAQVDAIFIGQHLVAIGSRRPAADTIGRQARQRVAPGRPQEPRPVC